MDNAISVGSPGAGVNHAKDLHIGAGHVWAATAKDDLVNLVPPPAGTLAPLNPQTFHVADGKFPGTDGFVPAHGQYWEGDSLTNMAKIVTGGTP